MPRYFDAAFFAQTRLDIYRLLTRYDLIKFLIMKNTVYPELVKVFYTNLKYQDSCLLSKVKGVKIVIDHRLFYELTGLSLMEKNYQEKELLLIHGH